jgi:hypothetical protein
MKYELPQEGLYNPKIKYRKMRKGQYPDQEECYLSLPTRKSRRKKSANTNP